jgi:hypothetical protein
MFYFHKPEWLYEALPSIYVVAGITTIANLGNTLSIVSGSLLISAGLFIWTMRRTSRQELKCNEEDRKTAARKECARRAAAQRHTQD